MTSRQLLLLSAALIFPGSALAQPTVPSATPASPPEAPSATIDATNQPAMTEPLAEGDELDGDAEIVVTGQRPRGSVIGDIPPENVLTSRDIRATGATSIQELLDAVAPQTGSARGRESGAPLLLLNGQRISGFRELRDIPPEAIERMEILPEEVALKYGFAADQRVVNIVLRQRFDAKTVEARGRAATDGGYVSGSADGSKLLIRGNTRSSIALHVQGNTPLYESERDIRLQPISSQPDPVDPRGARTLLGAGQTARLSGSFNRTILGDVSATLSPEVEITRGRSRFGVATATLTPSGQAPILRAFDETLGRVSDSQSAELGLSLNGAKGKWKWSATGNGELVSSVSRSDRGPDVSALQTRLDAGDPTLDPLGDFGPLVDLQQDRGKSVRREADLAAVLNGPLVALPAGMANVTFKLEGSALGIDSVSRRAGVGASASLSRTVGDASVNVDLPLAKRGSAIGRLTANANAGVSRLSDFGTLTSLGGGLNWSPTSKLSLLASWTRDENAPSLQALGDPLLTTPGVPFFDATRGETVDVTTVSGGNPELGGDRRNVFKLGGNWQPFAKADVHLRAEYVSQSNAHPQVSFPAATPALEAAFPDRFRRDADGKLVRVDLRPVNADRSRRDTLRIGFDFTKPLKATPPTPAQIARLRQQFSRVRGMALPGATPAPGGPTPGATTPPDSAAAPGATPRDGGGRAGGSGRGGRGGGFGGGGRGGRLTFSLTDTVTLTDWLEIAPELPRLDYLDGEALNGNGGRPRHAVEAQGGYYNNGLGARLSANWRSATQVDSAAAGDSLRFSPYATFDLRLFANLGERLDLIGRSPFFLGSSVQFQVTNIFNSRPNVRDGSGAVPLAYQADRLEPIGRTVGISFRKLFLPTRFFRPGGGGGGGFGGGGGERRGGGGPG